MLSTVPSWSAGIGVGTTVIPISLRYEIANSVKVARFSLPCRNANRRSGTSFPSGSTRLPVSYPV